MRGSKKERGRKKNPLRGFEKLLIKKKSSPLLLTGNGPTAVTGCNLSASSLTSSQSSWACVTGRRLFQSEIFEAFWELPWGYSEFHFILLTPSPQDTTDHHPGEHPSEKARSWHPHPSSQQIGLVRQLSKGERKVRLLR